MQINESDKNFKVSKSDLSFSIKKDKKEIENLNGQLTFKATERNIKINEQYFMNSNQGNKESLYNESFSKVFQGNVQ